MIRQSFIFLDGIGTVRERSLWKKGILDWKDFLESKKIKGIPEKRKSILDREIEEADFNLSHLASSFFFRRLPGREHWRLFSEFREHACFIDIETTGLSAERNDITVVGVYNGREYKSFIRGINLEEESLKRELEKYSLIITFYGSAFDIPFLIKKFPTLSFEKPHIDLCFTSRRIGLSGGLKKIEEDLGLEREDDIKGMSGFDAVRLWKKWEVYRNRRALETLVEYNRIDVKNLSPIAEHVYDRLKKAVFADFIV
ncbi:hypothetical protein IPdc08_00170 [archaeon]|nr:hypothetical protein IPdc08_00170 [archaeon]